MKIVGGCGECLFPRAGVVRPRVRRIDGFLFISTGKSGLILDFIRLLLFLLNVKVYVICYGGVCSRIRVECIHLLSSIELLVNNAFGIFVSMLYHFQ